MKPALRLSAAVLSTVAVVCGGVGWLYLLRGFGAFAAGAPVAGALPLQRLAGGESEPLARVLVAWLAAGVAEAVVLVVLLQAGRIRRAAVAGTTAAVTLIAAGAVSDAVTASEPIRGHVLPQLSRPGLWVAVAVLVACSLIPAPADRAPRTTRRRAGAGLPRPA